jgi:MFS family permease
MAGADEQQTFEPVGPPPLGGPELPAASAATSSALARLLRIRRPAVFEPLHIRDFKLFWAGQSVSMVGDGIYTVAIAWQVYSLSNVPTALAVVGIAQTIPLVAFVLVGGVLADRLDRRRLMIVGAAIPGIAIAALSLLAYADALELWHVWMISAAVGLGRAVFGPASGAFVPDIVPANELVQANALAQLVRPLASTLLGPALGGLLVASVGTATCFAIDAASFGAAVVALLLIPSRPIVRAEHTKLLADIREGFSFIRRHVWIWGTLTMATVWVVVLLGPLDVLVPYIVKNDIGGGAGALGLVYACGGIGAIASAAWTGQLGLPRQPVTRMLLGWSLGCATVSGIALATATWQAALAMLVFNALLTFSEIVWISLLQRLVPTQLLGRVRSLDWLLSVGLVPISFALTGPIANALGARTTLAAASVISATIALATLLLPGMRADPVPAASTP